MILSIDKVIDAMQEGKLPAIRSLGRNSLAEIHVKIYEFGYSKLNERARKEFVRNLLELNKDKYYIA